MLALFLSLSFLARSAMSLPIQPPDDSGLGVGPHGGQLLGEPPGRSEYELKLMPDNRRIEVRPLDPSRAPSRQEFNNMSAMLLRNKTNGAIDQVELQPAVPDATPAVPYYTGRLSTQDSSFFGVELRLSFKDGGERTLTDGKENPGVPSRALGP